MQAQFGEPVCLLGFLQEHGDSKDSCITQNAPATWVKMTSLEFPAQPTGLSTLESLSQQLFADLCPWGGALLTLPFLSFFCLLIPSGFLSLVSFGQEEMFYLEELARHITSNWIFWGSVASCTGFSLSLKSQVRVGSLAPCHPWSGMLWSWNFLFQF